jgi:hypothetical protein
MGDRERRDRALVSRPRDGTSTVQIEDTYARWLKRTDDQLRAAFDSYDARTG